MKAPSVDLNFSEEKYKYFKTRWRTYKNTTGVTGAELIEQLMDTCSGELHYTMFQDNSEIESSDEATIFASIKKLTVKKQNVMVSRIGLHSLQQEDEGIRNYTVRVKGQAELCAYTVKCTAEGCNTEVRYTNVVVQDALIRGMYDTDYQRDVLGQENQDMELEPLLMLIEAKEIRRKTQASILGETGGTSKTSYKGQKWDKNPSDKLAKYCFCGKPGHGANENIKNQSTVENTEANCPAFKSTCDKCKKKGHFTAVCKSKLKKETTTMAEPKKKGGTKTKETDDEGACPLSIFTQMCTAEVQLGPVLGVSTVGSQGEFNTARDSPVPGHGIVTPVPGYRIVTPGLVQPTCLETVQSKVQRWKRAAAVMEMVMINEAAFVTKIANSGHNKGQKHIVLEAHQFDSLKGWTEKQHRGQP